MSRRPDPQQTFEKIRKGRSKRHAADENRGKLKRRRAYGSGSPRR